MSGDRILVGLGDVETTKRIIHLKYVLKADTNFWRRDMAPSKVNDEEAEALKADLDSAKKDIENCKLQKEGRQLSSTIVGYAIHFFLNCQRQNNVHGLHRQMHSSKQ